MKLINVVFLLCLTSSVWGQNLVLNPSFEDLRKKENKGFSNSEDFNDNLLHWTSPTRATPDYHNQNPEIKPKRYSTQTGDIVFVNTQVPPRSGDKMAGIHTYGYAGSGYCDKLTKGEIREYIQGTLKQALVPGENYFVRFWITKTKHSPAVNNLGIAFRSESVQNDDCYLLDFEPQIIKRKIPEIENKEWVALSGTFKASEAFRYFIIGNFKSNEDTEIQATRNHNTSNYYYIDDIYITKALTKAEIATLKAEKKKKPNSLEDRIEKDKVIVLDQVFFETDSWVLKVVSFPQLEELAQWLKSHSDTKILIKGHTDNRGKENYNQQLSEKRAQSVTSDLQKRGVAAEQLKAIGYGSQQALNNNQTKEERQNNRRVEFEVVEKF